MITEYLQRAKTAIGRTARTVGLAALVGAASLGLGGCGREVVELKNEITELKQEREYKKLEEYRNREALSSSWERIPDLDSKLKQIYANALNLNFPYRDTVKRDGEEIPAEFNFNFNYEGKQILAKVEILNRKAIGVSRNAYTPNETQKSLLNLEGIINPTNEPITISIALLDSDSSWQIRICPERSISGTEIKESGYVRFNLAPIRYSGLIKQSRDFSSKIIDEILKRQKEGKIKPYDSMKWEADEPCDLFSCKNISEYEQLKRELEKKFKE
jgi:hypothetical protein